jgi:hypothetical protein
LEHLGIKLESVQKPEPLLAEDPRNVDAAMMLMRIYAQDLRQPHQAKKNPSGAGKATSCFTCPLRVCPPVHCGMEPGKTQAGKGCNPPDQTRRMAESRASSSLTLQPDRTICLIDERVGQFDIG